MAIVETLIGGQFSLLIFTNNCSLKAIVRIRIIPPLVRWATVVVIVVVFAVLAIEQPPILHTLDSNLVTTVALVIFQSDESWHFPRY